MPRKRKTPADQEPVVPNPVKFRVLSEGKLLRAGAAATIAYDLKVLHRISTELGDE